MPRDWNKIFQHGLSRQPVRDFDMRSLFVKGAATGVEFHIFILLLTGGIFLTAAIGILKFKGAKDFAGDNAQGIQSADT